MYQNRGLKIEISGHMARFAQQKPSFKMAVTIEISTLWPETQKIVYIIK